MGVPRKIVQIAAAGMSDIGAWPVLYALADDGSLWVLQGGPPWQELNATLPEAEACGAVTRAEPDEPCRLAKGHRDPHHWSGARKWA